MTGRRCWTATLRDRRQRAAPPARDGLREPPRPAPAFLKGSVPFRFGGGLVRPGGRRSPGPGRAVDGAHPVRGPGRELGRLARLEDEVVVAEDEPKAAGDDVEPFVALVGARARGAVRSAGKSMWATTRPPGACCESWRMTMPSTTAGVRATRGSRVAGASRSPTSTPRAPASGVRWSSASRRAPDSRRLSVEAAMPARSATSSWLSPRSRRSACSRARTSSSVFAISA